MADGQKITELPVADLSDGDEFAVVDGTTTKRATVSALKSALGAGVSSVDAATGAVDLSATYVARSSGVVVVDAGSDLSTARPSGADVVLWQFDNGTDPGTDGANVTNGQTGDLYFVAAS